MGNWKRLSGIKMVEEKSFFEEFNNDKPESFEEEVFVKSKSKKPIYLALMLLFALILFFGINLINRVEIPDMITWDISEVNAWAKKNKITLIGIQSYDVSIDVDHVLTQGTEPGTKVKKNSSVEVTFSKGADPDEIIPFPEIKSMKLGEIQTWIKTNKLSGVNIKYENSNSIEKNTVISVTFVDGDISNFIRKNRVKIIISKGTAELTETLSMPELYGKTKQEVLKWAVDNKIKVNLEEVYSDYIEANYVISQDIPKDNKFNRTDTVTIQISKGQAISVPNFMNLTSGEANTLAGLYDLRLFIKSVPSTQEPDRIVYQSIEMNAWAKKNDIITLHVSKKSTSQITPDFIGLTKTEVSEMAAAYNFKVVYKAVDSTEKKTTVLSQSLSAGAEISDSDVLTLTISDGSIKVPDFKGMSKIKAESIAEDLGLKVLFNPVVNVHEINNQIVKQDILVDEIVESGRRITLDVAVNKGIKVIDLTSMTKSEAEFWAKTKGFNLRVIDVYSSTIKKNQMFDQNYKNIFLPETEPIIVYHSLGKVSVGNLVGQTKEEAEAWVSSVNEKGANITVEYRTTRSSTYSKGQITNQTPKNQTIDLDGTVVFYICSTKVTTTPDTPEFNSMTEGDFIKWCNSNQITYKINEVYSSTVKVGYIFGENLNKGITKGEILNVKESLGSVPVESFVGKTKTEFEQWLSNINSKDGNIQVKYITQIGGSKDNVTSQSVTSGLLDVGSTITVTLYTGL